MSWKIDAYQAAESLLAATVFLGDYYPLTPYSLSEHDWIAWQFDRPSPGS